MKKIFLRIKNFFSKKTVTSMMTAAGIPVLFSCGADGLFSRENAGVSLYGMPPNYGYISGTVRGDVNKDGKMQPLPNVKIYSVNKNTDGSNAEEYMGETTSSGKYYLDLYESGEYTFRFEDGDGEENGLFKPLEKTFIFKGGTRKTGQDVILDADTGSGTAAGGESGAGDERTSGEAAGADGGN